MDSSDQSLVALLERIAIALEKIAGTTPESKVSQIDKPRTAFPWHEVSERCRKNLRRLIERTDDWPVPPTWEKNYRWPLSCEDLMEIGVHRCMNARNWANEAAKEVHVIMERLGFPNWIST